MATRRARCGDPHVVAARSSCSPSSACSSKGRSLLLDGDAPPACPCPLPSHATAGRFVAGRTTSGAQGKLYVWSAVQGVPPRPARLGRQRPRGCTDQPTTEPDGRHRRRRRPRSPSAGGEAGAVLEADDYRPRAARSAPSGYNRQGCRGSSGRTRLLWARIGPRPVDVRAADADRAQPARARAADVATTHAPKALPTALATKQQNSLRCAAVQHGACWVLGKDSTAGERERGRTHGAPGAPAYRDVNGAWAAAAAVVPTRVEEHLQLGQHRRGVPIGVRRLLVRRLAPGLPRDRLLEQDRQERRRAAPDHEPLVLCAHRHVDVSLRVPLHRRHLRHLRVLQPHAEPRAHLLSQASDVDGVRDQAESIRINNPIRPKSRARSPRCGLSDLVNNPSSSCSRGGLFDAVLVFIIPAAREPARHQPSRRRRAPAAAADVPRPHLLLHLHRRILHERRVRPGPIFTRSGRWPALHRLPRVNVLLDTFPSCGAT